MGFLHLLPFHPFHLIWVREYQCSLPTWALEVAIVEVITSVVLEAMVMVVLVEDMMAIPTAGLGVTVMVAMVEVMVDTMVDSEAVLTAVEVEVATHHQALDTTILLDGNQRSS